MTIWCPGCGCDVSHLLRVRAKLLRKNIAKSRADQCRVTGAAKWLRAAIAAMEHHAQAKSGVVRPVDEIYRMWSAALLDELTRQFPTGIR